MSVVGRKAASTCFHMQAAMAPVCVAVSVSTAMRPRACSLAHVSMPHAARRALATCDPCSCAGAKIFDLRRATTSTCYRPSSSTPTTRGRQRRRRAGRGHRRFTTSACSAAALAASWPHRPASSVKGRRWPPVADGGRHQCCGWPHSQSATLGFDGVHWAVLPERSRYVP